MEVLWSDHFEGEEGGAPDSRYWGFEVGDGTAYGIPGWGNQERQFYTTDAARLDGDSHLRIQAKRVLATPAHVDEIENYACYYGPRADWTSARLTTRDRVKFQYGRIEARSRFPFGVGTWPAIWMLGCSIDHQTWPQCGEIDIAEGRGRDPRTVFGTVHGPGYFGEHGFGTTIDLDSDVATDFHLFGIDWRPGSISWHIDGEPYHSISCDEVDEWVFDQPFYLLLNLAIGGTFAGEISTDLAAASMLVDFVRYSTLDGCGTVQLDNRVN